MNNLTGRTRYRVGWFGRLILQVEFAIREPHPAGDHTDWLWTGRDWRDARCEDFTGPGLSALFNQAPIPNPGQKPARSDNCHPTTPACRHGDRMTPEELQASVDAFLRDGGAITKLNYAGVPVDDEYGRPIHVPARAEPPVETVPEWCERVAAPPPTLAPVNEAYTPEPLNVAAHVTAIDAQALADYIDDMRPQQEAYMIAQLRQIRRDARRWLARLDRVAA